MPVQEERTTLGADFIGEGAVPRAIDRRLRAPPWRVGGLCFLMSGCAPPELPEGRPDARFSLRSWQGESVGEDVLGTTDEGVRVEHLRADSDHGPSYRLSATLTGPDLAWEAVVWAGDRWERWGVGPDEGGGWAWSGRQGLALHGGALLGAPVALAEGAAQALPAPRNSLLLWERLLADPGDRTVEALDPRTGRTLPLRVETRGEETLTRDGAPVLARRVFAWTASDGASAWVDAESGALLAVRGLPGWRTALREGVALPSAPRALPDGIAELPAAVRRPDLVLHGQWTKPTDRPHAPTVLLLHGSGPGDRDGNYGPVQPYLFRDLAYGLASRGYAVLRTDKRGVGESRPADPDAPLSATLDDLLGDAAAWQDLAAQDDPGSCQFLIGHSEGGYLAPARAVADSRVAGVVLLGGPARPLDAVMAEQLPLILPSQGADGETVSQALRVQKATVKAIRAGHTRDPLVAGLPAETEDWLRSHFDHDAEGVLRQLRTPILALYGERDLQVPPAEAEEMRRILAEIHHPDATVEMIPGVDHLFLKVPRWPGLGSYSDPDRHLDPAIPARIADWLDAHPCPPPQGAAR